jgi:hypothetical protein
MSSPGGPSFSWSLTYAQIPFLPDDAVATHLRVPGEPHQFHAAEQHAPKLHQPETRLVDEIERLIPQSKVEEQVPPASFPGRNLGAIAFAWRPEASVDIGEFFYPNTASRWARFRGLATSSMVKAMVAATNGGQNAATFAVQNVPMMGNPSALGYSFQTQLYMLPPRPIGENPATPGGINNGLYAVTLVDERYYWPGIPATLRINQTTTWTALIAAISTVLGVPISTQSAIEAVYGQPEPDSQLWCNTENPAVLLDAIGYNIGRILVRNLDGSYTYVTATESAATVQANRGMAAKVQRLAGGEIFASGTALPAGDLTADQNAVVPNSVLVTFPQYIVGNDPVPHFVNARYQNQRPSCWYEESHGGVWGWQVPITSGGPLVLAKAPPALSGVYMDSVHTTAKAMYSGEAFAYSGNPPMNASGLISLAGQLAVNRYSWQVATALDEVYPGTVAWQPDGLHSITWTWSQRRRLASTRVLRDHWNVRVTELQHSAIALSGYTNVPQGVGGPSVAQSWRDSFSGFVSQSTPWTGQASLASSTSVGQGSITVNNPVGFPLPPFSIIIDIGTEYAEVATVNSASIIGTGPSWTFNLGAGLQFAHQIDAPIEGGGTGATTLLPQTTLAGGIGAGNTSVSLTSIDCFPTQNRWHSVIQSGQSDQEICLMEGTSGQMQVGIVYRGIWGSIAQSHNQGAKIQQYLPNTVYGANLVTFEKGQFVQPGAWTSGGIQEAVVIPQTQTVKCLDAIGTTRNGLQFYSGQVTLFNPTQGSGFAFDDIGNRELTWLVERNNRPMTLGKRYDGLLSALGSMSGFISSGTSGGGGVAPVYVVNDEAAAGLLTIRDSALGFGAVYLTSGLLSGAEPIQNSTLYAFGVGSGYTYAILQSIDCFPTQNNWLALIDSEFIVMNGTSGGIPNPNPTQNHQGFAVSFQQRGAGGSLPEVHQAATPMYWVPPDFVSGVNLITHEKSQYIFPGPGISGNLTVVEGVIKPQTQTVYCAANSGVLFGDNVYRYPGNVNLYLTTVVGYDQLPLESIWVEERNQDPVVSGKLYAGQFAGFSKSLSGAILPPGTGGIPIIVGPNSGAGFYSGGGGTAPIYLINEYNTPGGYNGLIPIVQNVLCISGNLVLITQNLQFSGGVLFGLSGAYASGAGLSGSIYSLSGI